MNEYVISYAFSIDSGRKFTALIHKNRPEELKGVLNLPGGRLNEKEDPVEGAIRELKEETGLDELQEYDPMVYYPSERMGAIKTRLREQDCIIHCVRIPVVFRQKLQPGEGEDEPVAWFPVPELYELPKLMPNLRLAIPLMDMGAKDWTIEDTSGNWRWVEHHKIGLTLNKYSSMQVLVKGMGYYES